MEIFDLLGWLAAALTFLTYSQKTMLRLRILGIGANVCFISWSLLLSIYPTLLLHTALLPINLYRLYEILRMRREARSSVAGLTSPLDWLRPLAKSVRFEDGTFIFRKGDRPDHLYYLVSGNVVFDELGKAAGPGELFGELAFLTSKSERTASARCEGPCEVFALDAADLATLSLQHPAFNFYVMRVIAERLTEGSIPAETPTIPFTDPQKSGR